MAERGEPLTDREREVLELVATGITNREVAQELFISINTVKVHLRNVYTKLGADSRTEATMIAVREGWVSVGEGEGTSPEASATEPKSATEPRVPPAPPLPWSKRIALLTSLAIVAFAVIVTGPRTLSQPGNGSAFLDESRQDGGAISSQRAESPWQERAQMPTRRAHLALAAAREQLLAIGGRTPAGITAAVEAYDPEADIWTPRSDKPTAVAYVGAATIGSEVYVPGGCDAESQPTQVVEVYNAETDTWREVSPLPEPRCAYALVVREDQLYLFGGWDGERYVSGAYAYAADADEWRELPSAEVSRGFAGAAALNDQLYVVGGYDGEKELTTCAVYDPRLQAWGTCSSLAVGRGGLGLAAVGGRLYAIGGGGWSSYLGFNEKYNPKDDSWSAVETPLVREWLSPGVAVLQGTVYAVGGWSSDYLSLNQAYEALPFRIFIPVSQ
jgi:DNA-binding CsgD family transcriptional regulator